MICKNVKTIPVTIHLCPGSCAAKMRMLRWISEMMREDMIRNDCKTDSLDMPSIVNKISANRPRLFGHAKEQKNLK